MNDSTRGAVRITHPTRVARSGWMSCVYAHLKTDPETVEPGQSDGTTPPIKPDTQVRPSSPTRANARTLRMSTRHQRSSQLPLTYSLNMHAHSYLFIQFPSLHTHMQIHWISKSSLVSIVFRKFERERPTWRSPYWDRISETIYANIITIVSSLLTSL
jgi:hypothetical protein